MKILLMHNYYQHSGGETVVLEREKAVLEEHGQEVRIVATHSNQITSMLSKVAAAAKSIYSPSARRMAEAEISAFKPDIVHVHNFLPLLSPSVYYACRSAGVPVVQSIHNYRQVCPGGQLLRKGQVCELCVKKRFAWPGIVHACYKGSTAATATVAAMLSIHHALGTWEKLVDVYIAPCDFVRRKLIEGGVPPLKIEIKPHFVDDDGCVGDGKGGYALFAGRLSPEKGVDTLLASWEELDNIIPLIIAGDGSSAALLSDAQAKIQNLKCLGWVPHESVRDLMRGAAFLIVPSKWYEAFGLVIIEAFSVGTPVIVSAFGAIQELVCDAITGWHFQPGDARDLVAKVKWAVSHPEYLREMRVRARAEFEAKYTPERNYELLMRIYQRACAAKSHMVHVASAR